MKIHAEVLETEYFDVHQDWEIPIPGFFILASKRKIFSIAEFTKGELEDYTRILFSVRLAMKEVLHIETVYFFQNEDSTHGFHVWIFPRYPWMEEFGFKIESVRPIMNFAKENLFTDQNLEQVRDFAFRVKEYIQKLK